MNNIDHIDNLPVTNKERWKYMGNKWFKLIHNKTKEMVVQEEIDEYSHILWFESWKNRPRLYQEGIAIMQPEYFIKYGNE